MSEFRVSVGEQCLLHHCSYQPGIFFRMKGLLGKEHLNHKHGILLKPCSQIHMFFMKMSIDAIFIDKADSVVFIEHSIRPWRVSKWVKGSCAVIECAAGKSIEFGLKTGDRLEFQPQ